MLRTLSSAFSFAIIKNNPPFPFLLVTDQDLFSEFATIDQTYQLLSI